MTIGDLHADDEAGFAQLLAIYREAIDPSEQKTEAALRAMLERPTQRFLVAREGGAVLAFAILWLPAEADIWSLEYMAVAPARRGDGLGADMFRASVSAAARPFGIIEVEAPTSDLQRRRVGFYARLGCRRLGTIEYLLPLRTHGAPPPMWLLVHASVAGMLPCDLVRGWLVRMYTEIYNETAHDPRIAHMLAGEGDVLALTALPATLS